MNLPEGWQLIGGLPVFADGDACVIASCVFAHGLSHADLFLKSELTIGKSWNVPCFSPAHFAAAEKLLRDHQQKEAEKELRVIIQNEHGTVYSREKDGRFSAVHHKPDFTFPWWTQTERGALGTYDTRPEAEAAAKKALMGTAK